MLDSVVLFYFGCLAVAVVLAVRSSDEALQKIAAALFAGWGFYNPMAYLVNFGAAVWWNIALDVVLATYIWTLWGRHGQPAAAWILCLFGAMFGWHLVELSTSIGAGVYLRGCNVLFLAQLLVLAGFSVKAIRRNRRRGTRPHGRANHGINAEIIEWPNSNKTLTLPRGSMSASRQHFGD